jgi:ATP-dependent DNA ligase
LLFVFKAVDSDARPNIVAVDFKRMPKGLPAAKARKWLLARYQQHRDDGYEGSIIYDLEAVYAAGDSSKDRKASGLHRIKPFEFIDVLIIGHFEGRKDIQGMLGGFVCKTLSGVTIRVGGGFKKHQRVSYYEEPDSWVGRVIEVERQENTPGIKSRHTNFKRMRDASDKDAETFSA